MKAINFIIWCVFVPSLMIGGTIGVFYLAFYKEEVKEVISKVRHGNDTLKVVDIRDSIYELEGEKFVSEKYAEIHKIK